MSAAEDELAAVEAALPSTWCPEEPLAVRVQRLVEVRAKFPQLLELVHVRAEALDEQRRSLRLGYLGLLTYAQRVAAMELSVSYLLRYVEEHGTVRMGHVKAVIEAREHLGDPYEIDPPEKELGLLEPFLRGKGKSVMLTGERLEALRVVLRWVQGMVRNP